MNIRILLYWLVVAIPLSWGVAQSVNSALPLFGGKSNYIPWVLGTPPAPKLAPSVTPAAAPATDKATATPAS